MFRRMKHVIATMRRLNPFPTLACALPLLAAVSQPALAQTYDDEMAMRWWNTLNGEQMVAALHGDSATMAQEVAAKKMYAGLDI